MDSSLIAPKGALFEGLFMEIGTFVKAPVDWLGSYYDQYPAFSVRRHPPSFKIVTGIVAVNSDRGCYLGVTSYSGVLRRFEN